MSYPELGVHENVPFSIYRSDDITQSDTIETVIGKAVSKSLITSFAPDPSAWKSSPPNKVTASMRAGSLFDTLVTEPDKMESRYVVSEFDGFRTKDAKEWRARIEETGATVVKQSEMTFAQAQLSAVQSKPEAMALLNGARYQVAFRHSTKYAFDAKGLIDIVPDDDELLVDVKTCEPSALESKRKLQRHILDWQYHVQAGGYCEGYSVASGSERTRFKFIFITNKYPIRVAVIELPFAAIMLGADRYRNGMKRFSECLESDTWPSLWDGETELDLPDYAYTETD